jgi:hypothetical protein
LILFLLVAFIIACSEARCKLIFFALLCIPKLEEKEKSYL